jgi:Tfp pilus assembly PilM family ATPase
MVSATTTGKSFVVDQVLAAPFRAPISLVKSSGDSMPTEATTAPSDSDISLALRRLISQANATGCKVLLNVPRSKAELRNFSLPQASADDLPDMVRFAAMRQFANLGDTWPIDFLVLPKSPTKSLSSSESSASNSVSDDNSIEVLATSVPPSLVASLRRICSDAGVELSHLGLRPVSTASLTIANEKQIVAPDETVLVIDVSPDEAELIVMERHQVVFIRTVRLSASTDGSLPKLAAAEVKRTLIAAMNSRAGITVQRIILWGSHQEMDSMVAEWSGAVSLPIECIDPFSIVPRKSPSERNSTSNGSGENTTEGPTARFAPLLGLLLQRQIGAPPLKVLGLTVREAAPQLTPWSPLTINFLAPRQRTIPPKPIRQYALGATAAGLVLAGSGWWYRSSHSTLDNEIADLQSQLSSKEGPMKVAQKNSADWQKISKFLEGDIQWLDQLEYLSAKALPPDQMLMGDTVLTIEPASNRGIVGTRVALSSPELEPVLEEQLRDVGHQVGAKGVNRSSDANTIYPWIVEPEMIVRPNKNVDPNEWKVSPINGSKDTEGNDSPEVKPEVKPEVTQEVTPEVKPELKNQGNNEVTK